MGIAAPLGSGCAHTAHTLIRRVLYKQGVLIRTRSDACCPRPLHHGPSQRRARATPESDARASADKSTRVSLGRTNRRTSRVIAALAAATAAFSVSVASASADTVQVNTYNGQPDAYVGVQVTDGANVSYSLTGANGNALITGTHVQGAQVQVEVTGQDLNANHNGYDTTDCPAGFLAAQASSATIIVGSGRATTIVAPQTVTQLTAPDPVEVEAFIALVNQQRAQAGLPAIIEVPRLDDLANAGETASDIATGCFFPNGLNGEGDPQRANELGINWTTAYLDGAAGDYSPMTAQNAIDLFDGAGHQFWLNPQAVYIGAAHVGHFFGFEVAGSQMTVSGAEPNLPRTSPSAFGPIGCWIGHTPGCTADCWTAYPYTCPTTTTTTTTSQPAPTTTSQPAPTTTSTNTQTCVAHRCTGTGTTTTNKTPALTLDPTAPVRVGQLVTVAGRDVPGAIVDATATSARGPAQHGSAVTGFDGTYHITFNALSDLTVTVTDRATTITTILRVNAAIRLRRVTARNGHITVDGRVAPASPDSPSASPLPSAPAPAPSPPAPPAPARSPRGSPRSSVPPTAPRPTSPRSPSPPKPPPTTTPPPLPRPPDRPQGFGRPELLRARWLIGK